MCFEVRRPAMLVKDGFTNHDRGSMRNLTNTYGDILYSRCLQGVYVYIYIYLYNYIYIIVVFMDVYGDVWGIMGYTVVYRTNQLNMIWVCLKRWVYAPNGQFNEHDR